MKTNLMKNIAGIVAFATLTGLAGIALAAQSSQQDQVTRLAVAKNRVESGALSVKPGQAHRMQEQADELQKLIDSAESGKKLSPAQVDEAIRRSSQGF